MTPDLTSLIERVEGGVGPDRELDCKVVRALSGSTDHWFAGPGGFMTESTAPALTASLDAVVSLIEAKLPGRARDLLQDALDDMGTRGWDSTIPEMPQIVRAALSTALRAIQESRNADR
jgi:hypothetical protein